MSSILRAPFITPENVEAHLRTKTAIGKAKRNQHTRFQMIVANGQIGLQFPEPCEGVWFSPENMLAFVEVAEDVAKSMVAGKLKLNTEIPIDN